MGPVTKGLLLLFGLALLLCLLTGLSTAQVTDVYLGDRDCNRNDTVLLGGYPLTFVALVHGDVVEFDVETDSTLVDTSVGMTKITDRIEGGYRLRRQFSILQDASPGPHVFTFTLDYMSATNESHRHVCNLTANLVRAIDLLDARITPGPPRALVLEVRVYVHCDRIEIKYDSDGSIQVAEEGETHEDLEPGVYTFSTRIEKTLDLTGHDADEVGYQITAVIGAQLIEIGRMNIPPDELVMDEGISPALVVPVVSVAVLAGLLAIIIRRRRRRFAHQASQAVGPGLSPPS